MRLLASKRSRDNPVVAEFDTTAVHRRQRSPPVELGAHKAAPDLRTRATPRLRTHFTPQGGAQRPTSLARNVHGPHWITLGARRIRRAAHRVVHGKCRHAHKASRLGLGHQAAQRAFRIRHRCIDQDSAAWVVLVTCRVVQVHSSSTAASNKIEPCRHAPLSSGPASLIDAPDDAGMPGQLARRCCTDPLPPDRTPHRRGPPPTRRSDARRHAGGSRRSQAPAVAPTLAPVPASRTSCSGEQQAS